MKIDFKWIGMLAVIVGFHAFNVKAEVPHSSSSTQKLRIYAECTFKLTTLTDCSTFKTSFFAAESTLAQQVSVADEADLNLLLTDEPGLDSGQIGYIFTWTSRLSDAPGSFALPLELSTSLDTNGTLNGLVLNAGKGVDLYSKIVSATPGDDQTVVVYGNLNGQTGGPTGWLANSPVFIGLNGTGTDASSGENANNQSVRSGSLTPEVAYMQDKYKVDVNGAVAYTSESIPDGAGGRLSAHNISESVSGLGVYSVSKDWSVAVINTYSKNKGGNVNFRDDVQTGVEWTLVPFRTTQNRELAFRVGPQHTNLTLGQANDLGHLQESYMSAFAQIYFYWVAMGDKLQSSLTSTTNDDFQHTNYYKETLSGTLKYQITPTFSINGSAAYIFEPRSLVFPANPNFSNAIQSTFLTDAPGSSHSVTIGVTGNLGAILKHLRDRRWTAQ